MIIQKFITVTTAATAMAARLKMYDRVETHGSGSHGHQGDHLEGYGDMASGGRGAASGHGM